MAAKKAKEALTPAQLKDRDERLRRAGWGQSRSERLPIEKWQTGLEVVGTLVSTKKLPDRNGKTGGHIFVIDVEDGGRQCYGAPTILWETLETLSAGAEMNILCTGKVPTARGQDAWTFDVRVKD